eukprot:764172-Hanusia_phi.AAC.4
MKQVCLDLSVRKPFTHKKRQNRDPATRQNQNATQAVEELRRAVQGPTGDVAPKGGGADLEQASCVDDTESGTSTSILWYQKLSSGNT